MRPFVGDGPEMHELSARMRSAWLAFARDGDPGGGALGRWPAYERSRRDTMRLGRECFPERAPLEGERAFWDEL